MNKDDILFFSSQALGFVGMFWFISLGWLDANQEPLLSVLFGFFLGALINVVFIFLDFVVTQA